MSDIPANEKGAVAQAMRNTTRFSVPSPCLMVRSSHGEFEVDPGDGEVLSFVPLAISEEADDLAQVVRFDLGEYRFFYDEAKGSPLLHDIDILDVGYWHRIPGTKGMVCSDGTVYEPAEPEWRNLKSS